MNKLNHLAIIVDGNGRWAKSIGKIRSYGHLKGYENLKKINLQEINMFYLIIYKIQVIQELL